MNWQAMFRSRKWFFAVFVIIGVIVGAILLYVLSSNVRPESDGKNENSSFFSFEETMQGWEARAVDLELADSAISWSITRTQEMAKNGSSSVRLYLENWNDMGKIWIERSFAVKPDALYKVEISYAFASSDWGDANLFRIITGVLQESPQSRDELMYQGYTGNGAGSDVGYVWLEKSYSFSVKSNVSSKLYVVIGVWGVWETVRTYYLDNLRIVFTELGS
jgi:hypothetical protein